MKNYNKKTGHSRAHIHVLPPVEKMKYKALLKSRLTGIEHVAKNKCPGCEHEMYFYRNGSTYYDETMEELCEQCYNFSGLSVIELSQVK